MKHMVSLTVTITVALLVLASMATADVPPLMHYQGHLTDEGGAPLDTTISMTFTIYDDSTGEGIVWDEEQPSVVVSNGLFNVLLGSVNPITDDVFADTVRWLGITVGSDPEISPRTRLVSVPYAFRVATVDGSTGGVISGDVDIESDLTVSGKATIGPGHTNTGAYAFVAGESNTASGDNATVDGGYENTASGHRSTVGGGEYNTASVWHSTVSGGLQNTASGERSTVGGGEHNTASVWHSTVSGGVQNAASGTRSTVGGGEYNIASGERSTVGGGWNNTASGDKSTVGGGSDNVASVFGSTVGGGWDNTASGDNSTVGGGMNNTASGKESTVGGGHGNLVEGSYSAILGGYCDTITSTADYSYLFGIGSKLEEDSTFMVDMPHIFFQGEIFQADSDGDTICELSGFDTGGGFIGTYGPNGNLNAAFTELAGYPDYGGVGALNSDGSWRSIMYADPTDDVGYVDTYGPNGTVNVRLWNSRTSPNAGGISCADPSGAYRAHFLTTSDAAGMLRFLGPNGNTNVYAGYLWDDHNNGCIEVNDNAGVAQVGMFVDTSGQGIVWGDTKNFRIPNPGQPGTDIWYCSLEGPEAAAYVRGTGHLVDGSADVTLPDHFIAVASSQGITVQVTPLSGESKGLAVVEKSTDRFAVRELNGGNGTYDFDFMVTAVRKRHEDYQVIRPAMKMPSPELGAAAEGSEVLLRKGSR